MLANRLTRDANIRVLLLEAGGQDDWFWIDIPVGYLYTIGNPRTDWCFKTVAEPGLNGRQLGYARGRVLGVAAPRINAMIYMRGQKSDFDHWAALGNRGWGMGGCAAAVQRHGGLLRGARMTFHGAGGELRVEPPRVQWKILDAWRDAAAQCGIAENSRIQSGATTRAALTFHMNQKRGKRWSATRAFLRPALGRPNLTVITGAMVRRVRTEVRDGRIFASGIEFVHPRQGECFVAANRETLLSAGAIGSPQILQLSGIGPVGLLADRQIPVVHALPGVGGNLQDHLQIRMVYKVQNTVTLNQRANSLWGKAAMGLEYLFMKTGPMTMPPSQLGAFAKSDPAQPSANIEWHVQPLSLDRFGEPLHAFNAITPSVCNLRPTSRGHVYTSPPPIRRRIPKFASTISSTPEDQQVAVDGMRYTRRIMAADALRGYSPEEWKPGPAIETTEQLVKAAGDLGTTIFHPVGTCKMGHDPLAVVDDELRVHGVANLRVIDASIMPRITSGQHQRADLHDRGKGAQLILSGKDD